VPCAAFFTHGGMNSVAEATFAHVPMLCMPFFSDQPDNCVHAEVSAASSTGRGTALAVSPASSTGRGTALAVSLWACPLRSILPPLFCMQDLGYAHTLSRDAFAPPDLERGLQRLLGSPRWDKGSDGEPDEEKGRGEAVSPREGTAAAIHRAWLQNVAAGGLVRAVQVSCA
jgi:hypothetical protein